MTFSYSRPFASSTEKTSGVLKCARAAAFSSSRSTTTATSVLRRVFSSRAAIAAEPAWSPRTSPGSPGTGSSSVVLSRSSEPKRACLRASTALAVFVTCGALR